MPIISISISGFPWPMARHELPSQTIPLRMMSLPWFLSNLQNCLLPKCFLQNELLNPALGALIVLFICMVINIDAFLCFVVNGGFK